jgi:acetate kinase
LIGVSQTSGDMQTLLQQRSTDHRAAEAVELFVYQAIKNIGALTAVLGGLDTLVFTGGIGENASVIRSGIAQSLAYLGIELDEPQNIISADIISSVESHVTVRVIAANENFILARHTHDTLAMAQDG